MTKFSSKVFDLEDFEVIFNDPDACHIKFKKHFNSFQDAIEFQEELSDEQEASTSYYEVEADSSEFACGYHPMLAFNIPEMDMLDEDGSVLEDELEEDEELVYMPTYCCVQSLNIINSCTVILDLYVFESCEYIDEIGKEKKTTIKVVSY